ncbi:MAG: coiled-coil domain-containing protein [Phycisphaerales bacterium]
MNATPAQSARTARIMLGLSPLAIAMAAGLTGCGSSTHMTRHGGTEQFTPEHKATLATVQLDSSRTHGDFTPESYITEGGEIELPQQWVSEAREGSAAIQAQRANAQSFEVFAESQYVESMAGADADLQDGFVARDTGYADAELTRSVHNANISKLNSDIDAREFAAAAKWERQEAFLVASVKEWQAEIERMRSQAEKEWSSSLAEHDRMMASYAAVRDRGQAEIDSMVQTADFTEQRAIQKAQSLRVQANTVAEQSQAEVAQLNQQIQTVTEQFNAEFAELTQRAHSLDAQMSSEIATLDAQANQFKVADADENYKLEVEAAEVTYEATLAEAEEIRLQAQEQAARDRAQYARMSSDAQAKLDTAKTTFTEAQQWVSTQYAKSMADIQNKLAQAQREEQVARSAYVKAEVDARVAAMKAEAAHNKALADAELNQIQAEAEAEAKQLQAKFAKEFAEQARKGSFVVPSNTTDLEEGVNAGDNTPELAKASKKPVNVEADRIAAFKTGLAKASQIRQDAEADRVEAIAQRDAEMGKFNDWFAGKEANFHATMASADAFVQKSNAEVDRMFANRDALIASGETERNRALIDAESGRTEILATVETLKGSSVTMSKKRDAKVKQLFAQADATKRIGESKVASLSVQRDSAKRRGEAKSSQLLAEASSLEQSQRAVVAQMREEIEGARQILDAELARLNQAAQSYMAIAKANYDEDAAMADAFERIAVANTSELTARHIASKKQSDADLQYMTAVSNSNELLRDAEVQRMFAQADEQLGYAKAQDIATRGNIESDYSVAMASATRDFTVADARESGVRSRFDHRVAATESDRNRAYAELYAQAQQQAARNEIAAAQAATYSEQSLAALERLNQTSKTFQLTAQRNWDSRLAMPSNLDNPASVNELYEQTKPSFEFSSFTSVPTDTE